MLLSKSKLAKFNAKIDEQHNKLNKMLAALQNFDGKDYNDDHLAEALNAMMSYASEHFSLEEKMMHEFKYPRIALHKKQHLDFLTKTSFYCIDAAKSKPGIYTEVTNYLTKWTNSHLETEDKKLDMFLIQCSIT